MTKTIELTEYQIQLIKDLTLAEIGDLNNSEDEVLSFVGNRAAYLKELHELLVTLDRENRGVRQVCPPQKQN